METEATETLAEIDGSLSSKRAQSQTLVHDPTDDPPSESPGSAVQVQENGASVSSGGGNEGFNGDVHVSGDVGVVIETRVVETEISVEKSFGCSNGIAVGGDGGFLGDAKVIGGSSSSEHERRDENERGGRSQGDSTVLIGDSSDGKVELDHNGISLVVEVHSSTDTLNASGNENDKGSVAEKGGDPCEKLMMKGSVSMMDEKGYKTEEGREKHELNHNGEENDEGGEDVVETDEDGEEDDNGGEDVVENDGEDDEGEEGEEDEGGDDVVENDGEENEGEDGEEDEGEDGEDVGDQEHEYLVGDFVWGKIRSHPWWPGQIYDASAASEFARKINHREQLLVAYFGDGSFSWCSPSQLKPFAKDFEKMSKQSNAKNFVNAVQSALDEIGRLVELKMTCSCIPKENRIGLARPLALNAGIKQGVLVPECDLSRLSIPQFEPAELVLTLMNIAEVVSITNMIELTVLRSWLSAFYQATGGHNLAMYHEPLYIEGLEDKNRKGDTDINGFSGSVEAPVLGPSEEDWLSLPVHPGFGQTNQSLLQKCPGISEDKLYHRRKKKSVAELMKEDMVVEPNKKKGSMVKDVTSPGKLVSTSGKKKMKSSDEAPNQGGSDFASSSGRKRRRRKSAGTLGSPKSAEDKVLSPNNGGGEGEEETKKDNVSGVESDDRDAKRETEAPSQGGSDFASLSGMKWGRRKSATTLGSLESAENKVSSAKNGSGGAEKETKKDNVSSVENDDRDTKRETEAPSKGGSDFASPLGRKRVRRKSAKTLGPPESAENKALSAKNGGDGGENETKYNVSRVENDRDAKRETEAPSQGGSDFASSSGRKRRRRRKSAETLGSPKSAENKGSSAKNGGGKGEKETKEDNVSRVENDRDAKSETEAPSQGGSDFASPSRGKRGRRKSAETLGSPKSSENKGLNAKNGGGEGEKETKKDNVSSVGGEGEKETKKDNVSSVENDDEDAKREIEKASASRERKKSKYLSPPFTSPKWRVSLSSSKRDLAESMNIAKVARIGERMAKAASQLIGSPPIVICGIETIQEKNPKELDSRVDASAVSSPQPPGEDHKKIIESVKINVSTKEVISAIHSAAINPLYLRDKNSVDMISEFISAYRSAIYLDGSNYKMYHKHRSSRKRKSLSSEPGLIPESKAQQTRNEKNEDGEASTPITLIVTFPPGFPLPSKNELITVFSKFGPLNETETDVLYNSYCARVVFVKGSDAEEAFKKSIKKSPLGPACVNYRLRYSSAAPRACEDKTPVNPSLHSAVDDEASRLLFIKKKLEMMTSLLEKSGGNMLPETKLDLEGEMKGLLEEVSTMAKSTSS